MNIPWTGNSCCSSPASILYRLGATVVAWLVLSLVGLIWCPLHATSAITILFAMSAGCFANCRHNHTYHYFIDGPIFLVAALLFLLLTLGTAQFPSWAVWVPLSGDLLRIRINRSSTNGPSYGRET
jgi:hypothetical protein